jgi:hypothetical protein
MPPNRVTSEVLQVPAHDCRPVHALHALPPVPHAADVVPDWHCPAEQQPPHDVASHAQVPCTQCWPSAHDPALHVEPHPSLAPHALPAQLGVQPHTPGVPDPPQLSGAEHAPPGQHACPDPPHVPQPPVPQPVPVAHVAHTAPPLPQALPSVPGLHSLPAQHPLHDVASHVHTPLAQRWPASHDPASQVPPHPSLAPHALPVQLGMQPHTPGTPPPPHASGELQPLPAQQGWPLPPHVPQPPVPQAVPTGHAAHTAPPLPHAELLVPGWQAVPSQQPAQEAGSHVQVPATQRSPSLHAPCKQMSEQPSLSPHALPAQLGRHAPMPHTLGTPPAPHASPAGQPPHEMSVPQRFLSCPHLPAQSPASSRTQAPSAAWASVSAPSSAEASPREPSQGSEVAPSGAAASKEPPSPSGPRSGTEVPQAVAARAAVARAGTTPRREGMRRVLRWGRREPPSDPQ